jgi:FkbM family methyltransferase
MTKRSWFGRCVDVLAARMGRTSDQPVLRIGGRRLHLRLDNKHEIAYFEKARAGIDDVDVAIARRLLRKGDAALDLGANIGFVSLHLLALGASQVQAFEPNPEIYQRLESLQCAALQCHSCAVGATSGFADLILSVSHHQGSTLYPEVVGIRPKVFGSEPQTVRVEVRPIDSLFPQTRFDYIKVDIEGGELGQDAGALGALVKQVAFQLIM